MERLVIAVPDMNDSFSRIALEGALYWIRFTWNEAAGRWSFGLHGPDKEPLAVGIRIVPNFPLNLQVVGGGFPKGVFGAYSGGAAIGRRDFADGRAEFAYIPKTQAAQ